MNDAASPGAVQATETIPDPPPSELVLDASVAIK
jgi:hypothetical protein